MKKYSIAIFVSFLLFYGLEVSAVEKEEREWQDESVYYIMVDRFNNGDFTNDYDVNADDPNKYHGGDFQGIMERLDYIQSMGFTTIGLSSIFANREDGYHGHWIETYDEIEEHFGTRDLFKKLVDEVHRRDMKIMIDFVMQEAAIDDSLIDIAKSLVTDTKIDGYRLIVRQAMSSSLFEELTKQLKSVNHDLYIILDSPLSNDNADESLLTGYLDYLLQEEMSKTFAQSDVPLQLLLEEIIAADNPFVRGKFMDTDGTVRFTREIIGNQIHPGPRWKLALTYMYTTPGVPIVYYGSEIALDGGSGNDNHRQMDFRTDKELADYIAKLGRFRNQLPSLTRGSITLLSESSGMAVFKREYEGETTVIALNNSSHSKSVQLSLEWLEDDQELRGLLNGDLVQKKNGMYHLILDRDEAEIYVVGDKTGMNIPFVIATLLVVVLFIGFLVRLKKR